MAPGWTRHTILLAGLIELRVFTMYRKAAVLLLNTLLLFLGLELAASASIAIATLPATRGLLAQITGKPNDLVAHHYLALPYYVEQQWASDYWQEHKLALKKTYHPYVIWRSPPFSGETLNIDQEGIRRTPGARCVPDAYKVFVFGGSAMWGWGAPDWGTIPAYLQAGLQATHNEPVCVVNFAENAYVSTQSLIQLQLELEADNVPDVVIFYDGVNDVFAASQTGKPVVHQNLAQITARFQDPQPSLVRWLQNSNSYRLLQMLVSQFDVSDSTTNDLQSIADTEQLAEAVVRAYLGNYKIVETLSGSYGFDFYFFWQPYILAGHKHLTTEEQNMISGLNWVLNLDPPLVNLFNATYVRIEAKAQATEHLHSLANVFDEAEAQVWIDTWGHVTPQVAS